ncbi:MAG TPA: hypothetical protein VGH73_13240 [Thermoanaerobaculia bacterium]|jgi:hypothetical protein
MYRCLHRSSIVSSLIVLFALGAAGVAAAQGVAEVRGSGLSAARSPEIPPRTLGAATCQNPAIATATSSATTAPFGKTGPWASKTASNGLSFAGTFSFNTGTSGARMTIDHVINSRSSGTSGPIRLALWATTTVPVYGGTINHFTLGTYDLSPLPAGYEYNNVDSGYVTFTAPPAGCYYVTLALLELQSGTYYYNDLDTASAGGTPDGSGYDLFSYGGAYCGGTSSCARDSNTACLLNGRFQVTTTYRTSSSSGAGTVMYFGGSRAESDESVFFWFFNSSNFEMGLKLLNACGYNNHFWVYIGGLTDQGWTVHILDTQTGATRTYSNSLGHLSSSVGDTSALPCP